VGLDIYLLYANQLTIIKKSFGSALLGV